MQGLFVREFYLGYFRATQDVGWLALSARLRLTMLEELMQWEMTRPAAKD